MRFNNPLNRLTHFFAVTAVIFAGCVFASDAVPPGWHVITTAADSALAQLGPDALIDRLVAETEGKPGTQSLVQVGGFLLIGDTAESQSRKPSLRRSAVMTEIVRRGPAIIPTLLAHLSDSRPTRAILDPAKRGLNGTSGPNTDVYDYRFHKNGPQPAGVNLKPDKTAAAGQWPYPIKVDDLCFIALGQIVNRRLYLAGPDFGNGMAYDGMFFLAINSPVESPSLAAAARADWNQISPEALAHNLENDALGIDDPKPGIIDGTWRPGIDRIGGLLRLLVYFPNQGSRVVETLLQRPLVHWALPGSQVKPAEPKATDSDQTALITALSAFSWDGLDAGIYALYLKAVDEEAQVVAARPPEGRLASIAYDLPLACAKRLIHQGHDEEFRAFFSAAVDRAKAEYPATVAAMMKTIENAPSPLQAPPNSPMADVERQRKEFQIRGMADTLEQPINARAEWLKTLGTKVP